MFGFYKAITPYGVQITEYLWIRARSSVRLRHRVKCWRGLMIASNVPVWRRRIWETSASGILVAEAGIFPFPSLTIAARDERYCKSSVVPSRRSESPHEASRPFQQASPAIRYFSSPHTSNVTIHLHLLRSANHSEQRKDSSLRTSLNLPLDVHNNSNHHQTSNNHRTLNTSETLSAKKHLSRWSRRQRSTTC